MLFVDPLRRIVFNVGTYAIQLILISDNPVVVAWLPAELNLME